MTEANQKIVYDHFVSTNQTANAEQILSVYPHFKAVPKVEPKPAPKKVKKESLYGKR